MGGADSPGTIFSQARVLLRFRNIRALALTGFLAGTYLSILSTILQRFAVAELGISVAVLGVLVAVGTRPLGLASSIAQPFGGVFADSLGRKGLMILGSVVAILSMVSFLAAAVTHDLLPLGLGFVLLGTSLIGNPATQAVIAETVAMDRRQLSVAFSVVFFFTALPGALFPFVVGYLVQTIGYLGIFAAAALLECVNLATIATQITETRGSTGPAMASKGLNWAPVKEMLRVPRSMLLIFIPFAMDAFSWGLSGAILYGMWTDVFKFTAEDFGLIFGVESVAIVLGQYPATKFLLRFGTRLTLALSEGITVLVMAGWLLSSSPLVFAGLMVVFGFAVALWVPASSSLLMSAAPDTQRGGISGKLAAVRGIAFAPAPVIGGLLFLYFGYYIPVSLGLVGETFTTVAFLLLAPRS